jgi:hypothetical protein
MSSLSVQEIRFGNVTQISLGHYFIYNQMYLSIYYNFITPWPDNFQYLSRKQISMPSV